MLMKDNASKPYFATWIANDELLVKEPATVATHPATANSPLYR